MRCVIVIAILSTITTSISLNVINQKNNIIENQKVELLESHKQLSTDKNTINNKQIIISQQNKLIKDQFDKLNLLNIELKQAKDANKHLKYIGKFLITYYDLSYESCGKYPSDPAYRHTYSGAMATPNITCAVDKSVISLGSYLYIDGIGCRIAQDIGGCVKGNHIDVFINDFSYDKYTTHYTDIYLIQ